MANNTDNANLQLELQFVNNEEEVHFTFAQILGTEAIETDIFNALSAATGCSLDRCHTIVDAIRTYLREIRDRILSGDADDIVNDSYSNLRDLTRSQMTALITGKFVLFTGFPSIPHAFSVPLADLVKLAINALASSQHDIKNSVDNVTVASRV